MDDARATLEAEGYVILRDVLDRDAVAAIQAAMEPLLDSTPTGRVTFEGFATRRVYNLMGKTRAVDALAADEPILSLCEAVLGPHIQLSIVLGICIGPGEKAQPIHHDDGLFPVPQPRPPLVVNTMWAITPFTAANGATRIVPGSHRSPEPPPADAATIAAEMDPGSVLVWLGTLYHGGGANDTDEHRLGIAVNYTPSWLRQQENLYLGIPRHAVRSMPERLQRLVGYSYHPPFIGFVDGRDPQKLLR